jgi:ATP phosphoribosyltransferase
VTLLEKVDIKIDETDRSYIAKTSDPRFEVILARTYDIPLYVHYGAVDLGITGHDLILERQADVHELIDLNFGKCQIVIAVSEQSSINSVENIPNLGRVATEFPTISRHYFEKLGKQVEILEVRGTAELAPKLGLAQIVVDLSSSGKTLRKNQLKMIASILNSTTVLVCNKISFRTFEKEINKLLKKLRNLLK